MCYARLATLIYLVIYSRQPVTFPKGAGIFPPAGNITVGPAGNKTVTVILPASGGNIPGGPVILPGLWDVLPRTGSPKAPRSARTRTQLRRPRRELLRNSNWRTPPTKVSRRCLYKRMTAFVIHNKPQLYLVRCTVKPVL